MKTFVEADPEMIKAILNMAKPRIEALQREAKLASRPVDQATFCLCVASIMLTHAKMLLHHKLPTWSEREVTVFVANLMEKHHALGS